MLPLPAPPSVASLLITGILALPFTGCIAPAVFQEVRTPRDGQPLGERVCLVYSDRYLVRLLGLERLHPFDINKYSRIYLRLVLDGLLAPRDVYVPEEISRADLLRVHTPRYLDELERDPQALARYLEAAAVASLPAFLTRSGLLRPFRVASGGTLLAGRLALRHGMAINLGGGYHHAEPDAGGGFCVYADIPAAIRTLQSEGLVKRALSIDLDVHQGNGTALCIASDPDVFTFDVHSADIYPIPKQKNDLDVPLQAGTADAEYLSLLRARLPRVFDEARPEIVFYQSGVDGFVDDPLGDFALSEAALIERDRLVFEEAERRRVPIVLTLGGGYSAAAWRIQYRSIRNLIELYGQSPRTAQRAPASRPALWAESWYVGGLRE